MRNELVKKNNSLLLVFIIILAICVMPFTGGQTLARYTSDVSSESSSARVAKQVCVVESVTTELNFKQGELGRCWIKVKNFDENGRSETSFYITISITVPDGVTVGNLYNADKDKFPVAVPLNVSSTKVNNGDGTSTYTFNTNMDKHPCIKYTYGYKYLNSYNLEKYFGVDVTAVQGDYSGIYFTVTATQRD